MKSYGKIPLGVVLSLSIVFVAAACLAQQRTRVSDAKPSLHVVPLVDHTLPYQGFGAVVIVDDGTLLIALGGEVRREDDSTLTSPFPSGSEILQYQLNTSGLAIIESKGRVFLDRNGNQLRKRGLRERQVSVTSFADGPNDAPNSLYDFTGDLKVAFDAKKQVISVAIADTESSRMTFNLSAPIVAGSQTDEMADSRYDNGAIADSLEDESILLEPPLPDSQCNISCASGSGSVTCTNSGCKCICVVTRPECICTNAHTN